MRFVSVEVLVAHVGMVDGVPVRDPGQEWARVLGEWMKVESIKNEARKLLSEHMIKQ